MSIPYIPKITDVGRNSAVTSRENGFAFEVTHVSFGTGLYAHVGNETALQNEIARVPISGGGRVAGMLSLVINTLLKDSDLYVGVAQPVDISEIGFWHNNVLFAIYANNNVIVRKVQGAAIANVYTLALKTLQPVDAANISVTIDNNAAVSLALLGEHLSVTNPHPQYATVLMLQDEALTREQNDLALSIALAAEITNRISEDARIENDRVNQDLALSIALAAEITNRINGDLAVLGQLNSVVFTGNQNTIYYGLGHTFTLAPNKTIKVILIGAGGGSGGSGGGGSGFGNSGAVGGDSLIYPSGNPAAFIIKAFGGLAGGGAYGGNGSSFALGSNAAGREVEINNLYDVVILSYQDGLTGNLNNDTPVIRHPTVKMLGLTLSGRGAKGTYGGGTAISGAASGGAFVEALIANRGNTPLALTIDCGIGGLAGTGNESNGINGNDGVCVVIHD